MDTVYAMARLPEGPGKFLPLSARQVVSGMASNAATAIARLGGEAALWAAVGDDGLGERLVAAIADEGIDCSGVQRVAGAPSAISSVLVDPAGERTIIPYYAPELLRHPQLPEPIVRGEFAAVMADVRWPAAAELALRAACSNRRLALFDADVASADVLDRLAPLATHVVASHPGAVALCGPGEPARLVRVLAERYPGEAVVTAGPEGACWFERETGKVRHVPAFAIRAVDTTAAGDVFHGALALALVEGRGLPEALRFAAAAAAIKCTRFGGRLGAPRRAEVEALLSKEAC